MKNKLTAQDLVNFFKETPSFDKSETDASILYGWSSTRGGLYSITDIYKYFEKKGYEHKDVDDVKWKYFQIQNSPERLAKLEKGKTHNLFIMKVKNFNPEYDRESYFVYYYYDISIEEANLLKKEYEEISKNLTEGMRNKNAGVKNISISKANRKAKQSTPRTKKPALTAI
jgi:hypothetical protein